MIYKGKYKLLFKTKQRGFVNYNVERKKGKENIWAMMAIGQKNWLVVKCF